MVILFVYIIFLINAANNPGGGGSDKKDGICKHTKSCHGKVYASQISNRSYVSLKTTIKM